MGRSDSGERCEVKRRARPPLLFVAFFTSHRSPLSERLEQVTGGIVYQSSDIQTPRPHSLFWIAAAQAKVSIDNVI